jgi:hypothetical protein
MIFSRFSSRRAASRTAPPPHDVPETDLREMARRAVARDIVDFHTMVSVEALGVLDARLMDISPYGGQLRATSRPLERGERVWILLPQIGEWQADIMWGLKGFFGCKFVEPIESDTYNELLPQLRGMHPGLAAERNA